MIDWDGDGRGYVGLFFFFFFFLGERGGLRGCTLCLQEKGTRGL